MPDGCQNFSVFTSPKTACLSADKKSQDRYKQPQPSDSTL